MFQLTEITDFNAPELDVYARLSEPQLYNLNAPERGIFIAESPKVIARALRAGCRPLSFLARQRGKPQTFSRSAWRVGRIFRFTRRRWAFLQKLSATN